MIETLKLHHELLKAKRNNDLIRVLDKENENQIPMGSIGTRKFGTPSMKVNRVNRLNKFKSEVGEIKNKKWNLPEVSSSLISEPPRHNKHNVEIVKPTTKFPNDSTSSKHHSHIGTSSRINRPVEGDVSDHRNIYYSKLKEKDIIINQLKREIEESNSIREKLLARLSENEINILTMKRNANKNIEKIELEAQKRLSHQRDRLVAKHNEEKNDLKSKLAKAMSRNNDLCRAMNNLQKEYKLASEKIFNLQYTNNKLKERNNKELHWDFNREEELGDTTNLINGNINSIKSIPKDGFRTDVIESDCDTMDLLNGFVNHDIENNTTDLLL